MILDYDGKIYVRSETNGITVYEKGCNLYKFYEGITLNNICGLHGAEEILNYLSNHKTNINQNIVFGSPFHVNWLIEETCNLDCIYCYAHDKMHHRRVREQIRNTVECIEKLEIINVGLSGGEPTLNPYLSDVIQMLDGRCSISMDTNGPLMCLSKMAALLKKANVLVRITLDAVDESIISKLRPAKNSFEQLPVIFSNVQELMNSGVSLMIHTVVTRYNVNHLMNVAEKLCHLGVKRWHMYGVNYSEKCKGFYNEIRLRKSELVEAYLKVKNQYGRIIEMSLHFDEESFNAKAILLIDSHGKFYVDSIKNGIRYIGCNPMNPTLHDIQKEIDVTLHCQGHLWTPSCL